MNFKKIILPAAVFAFAGCAAVGPDYKAPGMSSVPGEWHTVLNGQVRGDSTADIQSWWTVFNDKTLNSLIDKASENNKNLESAYYAVRASRASLKMTEADKLPTFDVTASATGYHYGSPTGGTSSDLYNAGFDASWELDVFGGVKRSVEAATAELGSTEEAMHDVMVTLISDLAENYINARALQQRIALADENVRIKQSLYDIAAKSYQAGVTDASDVKTAAYNLEYAKTSVNDLNITLEAALNRLAVLTGQAPGAVHSLMTEKADIPMIPKSVVTGIPADMVRRRPDVREAERNLAAQTAKIGVAMADKYPKFTLTGSIGYEASSAGSLLNTSNLTSSIGPSFKWAVFDLGAIKQNIIVQTETQKKYMADYEQAVLTAMEDVENAMYSYDQEYTKNQQMKKAYDSAKEAYDLAMKKYQAGVSDYTDVNTAESSYISYHDQLIQSKASADVYVVSLYKALGGGWEKIGGQK